MRSVALFLILICPTFVVAGRTQVQPEKPKDPCDELRFSLNEALTVSATDARTLPQCMDGKLVRMVGIYRVVFENSDLYDPTGGGGGTWVSFSKFKSAIKRCSTATLSPHGGMGATYGFVALGIFHSSQRRVEVDPKLPENIREAVTRELLKNSPRGYGHLSGWPNEFEVICQEKLEYFSDGRLLQWQTPEDRKRIIDWYTKETAR